MAPSTEVLIGDAGGQHVLIRPLARSQPDLFDGPDNTRIDCEVAVAAGGFRGGFRAGLRSEEFERFLEEAVTLQEMQSGTARFDSIEAQVAIELEAGESGLVRVTGDAADEAEGGNRLHFGFEIEAAAVPAICDALRHLLRAFPVSEQSSGAVDF